MKEQLTQTIKDIVNKNNLHLYDESATKQAIILKLLNILDWDIFNREEVYPEYGNSGKKVDYALRFKNFNQIFIEAKRVNEDLDGHQEQLLKYSFEEGVKLAILSNGLSWWFYLPLVEGRWEDRKFYTIDLKYQQHDLIADKFIEFLSKENVLQSKAIEKAKN